MSTWYGVVLEGICTWLRVSCWRVYVPGYWVVLEGMCTWVWGSVGGYVYLGMGQARILALGFQVEAMGIFPGGGPTPVRMLLL